MIGAVSNATHGLRADRVVLVAVLVRRPREEQKNSFVVTNDPDVFFGHDFDVVVEAAGQECMRNYGVRILKTGTDLLCTSMGALADDALRDSLEEAAVEGGARLLLASGAMPALDWMHSSASDTSTASRVVATQSKPPESWIGAKFEPGTSRQMEDAIDFSSVEAPTLFFEGTAREAGLYYPKNSNILAMLSMSTAGLDDTEVRLVADPKGISLTLEYEGSAGSIKVDVVGKKSRSNPRTSQVVPLSVIKALKNLSNPVVYGV